MPLIIALGACTAPSKVDPKLIAATAPESEQQSIARLMRISSHFQRNSFTHGNAVTLLRNGKETCPAMISAIAKAARRTDMESYQFDTIAEQVFAPLLLEKRAQGVEVHLIYDSWGSMDQNKDLFGRLRAGGVQVVQYNPLGCDLDPDHRDHRKLLVIDGQIAITGGVNITGAYPNHPGSRSDNPDDMAWRDTEGPIAAIFRPSR